MNWILIVMLTQAPSGQPSQLAVPGFTGRPACVAAAKSYYDQLVSLDPAHLLTFGAICVPSTVMTVATPPPPAPPPKSK